MPDLQLQSKLSALLRDIPDFPRPRILFKDITPLLASPSAVEEVTREIVLHYSKQNIEAVAAVEARGFIFGAMIAQGLNVPFIPVRKAGKLPFHKITEEYSLEYGKAAIEIHSDAIAKGSRVLIHDDVLATGGTATAAGNLVTKLGGVVAGYSFIINLSFLPGEGVLKNNFHINPHYLMSY
jgi:adenine phosphoribosyltransferase